MRSRLFTPDELLTYVPYKVSFTSEALAWRNFRVESWRKPPAEGQFHCPAGTHHELIVPLHGRNTTFRRFAGLTWSSSGEQLLSEYDFIPAGADNFWKWYEGSCEYASLDISPLFVAEAFGSTADLQFKPVVAASCNRVRQICALLVEEVETGGHTGFLYAESLMASLIALLVSRHSEVKTFESDALPAMGVRRAVELIQTSPGERLTLSELAAVAGLNLTTFCKAFRQTTGCSPHQFLLRERIGRARELLRSSRLTVTEIGFKLGFSSQAHFSTAFARAVGAGPSLYRSEVAK